MAILKFRLNRKNASGTYDTIHYETSSNIVMRPSGRTVEQDLTDFLPRSQNTDDVPQTLTKGQISVANSKVFAKLGNGAVRDLTLDTIYEHPTVKQCNYAYTHPSTRVCSLDASEFPWKHRHMDLSINIESKQNQQSTGHTLSTELYNMLYGKLYKLKLGKFNLTWTAEVSYSPFVESKHSVRVHIDDPAVSFDETKVFVSVEQYGKISAGQSWAQSFSGGETTLLAAMVPFYSSNSYSRDFDPVWVSIATPGYYDNRGSAPIAVRLTGTVPIDVWYVDC